METPSRFTFAPDGSTNVFQIPVQMKGDNYVRIDIDGVIINDRNKFDIVNNSIVFVNTTDVPAGSKLDILVVQTDEGISNLGNVNSVDTVSQNILLVNAVGTHIAAVINNSNNMTAIQAVDANMPVVVNAAPAAINAAASEVAAKASEDASKASENASKASEVAAENHKDAAASSATAANTSLSNTLAAEMVAIQASADADTSKNAAKVSEINAASGAATSTTKASEASASAAAAAASEAGVDADRVAAQIAATAAATSETNAAISETNAATSETNAVNSIASSASNAAASANSAIAASASENAASTSETNAATSAATATSGAATATTQASNAAASATAAATSETNAAVSAATATASITDVESARDQSQDARDTANLYKLAAEAAATSVTSTAAALIGFDLAAIAETKAVTAVDVFVYDTSKDSDGGAWRKRTQATSWYNETLNTATRGSRKEFPAVAVIVAEAAKVTIYDGDDPSLPMWHVEDYTGLTISAAVAINGQIWIGTSTGVIASDYAGDDLGTTTLDYTTSTTPAIVNDTVNDVATTVLPDAPIDAATGLPVPTIAVATNGGVSVITDSGAVYDSAFTSVHSSVNIYENRLSFGYKSAVNIRFANISEITADGWTGTDYNETTTPAVFGSYAKVTASNAISNSRGLNFLAEDPTPANGMIAYTTSTYNTGWMNGDIKGAFLSDTDDTDLVGGNIFTNSSFSTGDETGWTANPTSLVGTGDGSVDFSVVGQVTITEQGGSDRSISQVAVGSKAGDTLKITRTISATTATSGSHARVAFGGTTTPYVGLGYPAGTYVDYVTAVNDEQRITIHVSSTDKTVTITNFEVEIVDADRSVNANPLITNGTITKTPVATGADLVAYSGFSASNYLEQPYNSDLDFGTGDFCIMGWVNPTDATQAVVLYRNGTSGGHFGARLRSGKFRLHVDNNIDSQSDVPLNTWNFLCGVRSAGVAYLYINGQLDSSQTANADVSSPDAILGVGALPNGSDRFTGSLALIRISATAPTAAQIAKIYNDEKVLFQENAQATLYGTSDVVKALAHDDVTDLLHVGTSAGRSVFQGLRRVSNTTNAVGTAISASNGLVVEE